MNTRLLLCSVSLYSFFLMFCWFNKHSHSSVLLPFELWKCQQILNKLHLCAVNNAFFASSTKCYLHNYAKPGRGNDDHGNVIGLQTDRSHRSIGLFFMLHYFLRLQHTVRGIGLVLCVCSTHLNRKHILHKTADNTETSRSHWLSHGGCALHWIECLSYVCW